LKFPNLITIFVVFQDVAPSGNLLTPLLPPNPYLKSLKVDCGRLDDSSISLLVKPSLHELSLYNCSDFSGKLLSEIGTQCKDLRFVCCSLSCLCLCDHNGLDRSLFECLITKLRGLGICVISQLHSIVLLILSIDSCCLFP